MILAFDSRAQEQIRLDDPGDCSRFHVQLAAGSDEAALDAAMRAAGVGRMDGEEALVGLDAIRRLAEGNVGAAWDAAFEAMIAYAGTKGWIDDAGQFLRAHLVREMS